MRVRVTIVAVEKE